MAEASSLNGRHTESDRIIKCAIQEVPLRTLESVLVRLHSKYWSADSDE